MKQLFFSEWERMWKRKSTWLCLVAIPIILLLFVKYHLNQNLKLDSSNTSYVNFLNLPSMVLREQMIIFFDIIVLLLVVMSVTSEYRTAELRMVMIRAVSFLDIIKAKFLTIISAVFVFLTINFTLSTILGFIFFKHESAKFRMYTYPFTISESVLYNFKYYFIAFITLVAMIAVIMVICINCKTATGAVGGSLTFIIASSIYPSIYSIVSNKMLEIIDFSSLISIQHHGIFYILAQKPEHVGLILFVIALYIIVFSLIAFILFNDKDCYI